VGFTGGENWSSVPPRKDHGPTQKNEEKLQYGGGKK